MINNQVFEKLTKSELFNGVLHNVISDYLEKKRFKVRCYPAGKLIMLRGEVIDSLMLLIEGRLQAQIQGSGGKTLRIEVLKAPQAVAAGVLFSQDNRLPVSLCSLVDVSIVFIPKNDVFMLCSQDSRFMQNYFTDMGDKISILAEKIRLYQFNTIKQKLAGYILGLSGDMKLRTVKLVYSKEVLSEIMGVARPSLSREFSNLVSYGYIETSGKTIRIINRNAMEEILKNGD